MIALRSIVYNALFYVNIVVLMILGLPTMLFGRHGVFALARLWGAISLWLLDKVCGLSVEFRGLEHRPRGGVIVAAKHESFLETFALLEYAPDFAIILKRQLLFIPFFGQYLLAARQIAIDRSRGRRALNQISAAARPVIADDRQIIIYPEGTRRMAGAPARYKFGVTALYLDTGAPCHPVALNTGLFWGRRGFRRRPGVAVIEFLPPIAPGLDRNLFSARLQQAIEEGCDRLYAEAITRDPSLAAVLAQGRQSEATGAEDELRENN